MRAVIQRVKRAKVTINEKETREISQGMAILIGVTHKDTQQDAKWLAEKCSNLRIFSDNESSKFDKSVIDIKGDILIVSQFTLYGDCNKGRRPDFIKAAKPDYAQDLYVFFTKYLKEYSGLNVMTGEFKAYMLVEISNDGPVTLIIDSKPNG